MELRVNFTRENSGQVYVQPTGCFLNVIELSFAFESRFAVFDFDEVEIQVKHAGPETVLRVLDRFRCAVAAYIREHIKRTTLENAQYCK